jgi:hypothetical protein
MNPTVPKDELLEREARWSRVAGISALIGIVLSIASLIVQQSTSTSGDDTDADKLIDIHDHASSVILGGALLGLAWMAFAVPLLFLFFAAAGRSDRVRSGFGVFAVIGPLFLFASGVIVGIGITDAADQFDKELPGLERQSAQQPLPGDHATGDSAKGTGAAATSTEETTAPTGTATTGTETTSTSAEDSSSDEEDTAKENRAEDIVDDNGTLALGRYLGLPGILGMLIAVIYIPLWSMRTGLLTRFWATLGMSLAVGQIILGPLGQFGLILWFAAIGLMLLGVWPGEKPPAWDAGIAVPWPRPGEPPPDPDGPIEGSGREVSERPLPEPGTGEYGDAGSEPAIGPDGLTQGQRRKKRKRRS